jgi:hypothetical protein
MKNSEVKLENIAGQEPKTKKEWKRPVLKTMPIKYTSLSGGYNDDGGFGGYTIAS